MATCNDACVSLDSIVDWEIDEIERSACVSTAIASVSDEKTRKIFELGLEWLESFVMKPHPDLGRRGPVCPFAKPVHNENSLIFCVWDADILPFIDFVDVLKKIPESYFRMLARMRENLKLFSMCIFVQGITTAQYRRYIDEAHSLTKPAFMEAGLMLGEFHPLSRAQGAHSDTFRPMRSPQPAFVVRAMSPHDALFIDRPGSPTEVRLRELRQYQRWLGNVLPEAENARIRDRISELRLAMAAGEVDLMSKLFSNVCTSAKARKPAGGLQR